MKGKTFFGSSPTRLLPSYHISKALPEPTGSRRHVVPMMNYRIGKVSVLLIAQISLIAALTPSCQTSVTPKANVHRLGVGTEDLSNLGPIAVFYSQTGLFRMQRPLPRGEGFTQTANASWQAAKEGGYLSGLILVPLLGITVGGPIALVKGVPSDHSAQAMCTLSNALVRADFAGAVAQEFASALTETGLLSHRVVAKPWPSADAPSSSNNLANTPHSAVLIRIGEVTLSSRITPTTINPRLTFTCDWSVEFRSSSGSVLHSYTDCYRYVPEHRLTEWAAKDASHLHEALRAARSQIVNDSMWQVFGVQLKQSPPTAKHKLPRNTKVRFLATDFRPHSDRLYIAPVQIDPSLAAQDPVGRAELEKGRAELSSLIYEAINAGNLFKSVSTNPPAPADTPGTLQLSCSVIGFSTGSFSQRFWVGFGAGMPVVTVEVKLTHMESKRTVLLFEAMAKSSWLTTGLDKNATIQARDRQQLANTVRDVLTELCND